jgi:Flp pilus assembly protein TadG
MKICRELNMSRMKIRMVGKGQHRTHRRRGSGVLELALTLSILFSICYGLIEYGYYFFVKNTMEGAAREGCRAGIVTGGTTAECNAAIINQLQAAGLVPNGTSASAGSSTYTIGNYTVTFEDTPQGTDTPTAVTNVANIPTGDTLTVQITAVWGTVGAAFRPAAMIGASKVITTASSMRVEG